MTKRIGYLVFSALILILIVSCARMGQPDGGWYDDTPPRILSSSPADKATGVDRRKITISFDEFVKLEDATNKVVVSPPQLETPEIKTQGKKIVVELKDSLKDNTTYTVDFADAITDNNEGNPMGSYTYCFSTGEQIDTLEVAGIVLDASNLEPIKGIMVGLYDDLSDTAFTTKPMVRVARTDSRGRFVIKGVATGKYRVYALQDADGNYVYNQKSEMVAFSHDIFIPEARADVRQDTVWRDSLRIDSIVMTGYTHFYPDKITLMAFVPETTDRYLIKTERKEADRIEVFFSNRSDLLPRLRGLNFNSDNALIAEWSAKKDTVTYWIADTALVNIDSLEVEMTYLATDTNGVMVTNIDTMMIVPKMAFEKRRKLKEKEIEKWMKEQEKAKKKGLPYDSIMPMAPLDVKIKIPSSMSPMNNVNITLGTPPARFDTTAIHLYSKIDSLWYRSRFVIEADSNSVRNYTLKAEWRPGVEYSLEIDSAAIEDIYGHVSGPIKNGIRVKSDDDFSSLTVNISGLVDSCIVLQLLNSADAVVRETTVENGSAEFYYLNPGTYYMRAFVDANGNGLWDTGNYYADLQPERVYYNPTAVECKAKWDVTHNWTPAAKDADVQKPTAIKKQKGDSKGKMRRNRNLERAKQKGITYVPGAR